MAEPERFEELTAALAKNVREHPAITGLVLLGSASEAGRSRRDEWSDHDFFAIAEDGAGPAIREDLSWLPSRERLVLALPEGGAGVVALYDDGHLFEFAAAHPAELKGARATDATVAVDDEARTVANLITDAQELARAQEPIDPAIEAGLALIKLQIGVGRERRGESVSAGLFVRTWAVMHLVRALRGRLCAEDASLGDILEPTRRLEHALPAQAAAIADAVAQPVERAARSLYRLLRTELEVGWPKFPTAAADVIARRLGW